MRLAVKQQAIHFLCIHVANVFKAKSLITEIQTEFMKGKNVDSSYKTLHALVQIRRVRG